MLALEFTTEHPSDTVVLHQSGAIIGTIKILRIRRGRDGGPPTVRLGFNFPRSIDIDRMKHYQPKGHKNGSDRDKEKDDKENDTEQTKSSKAN